MNFRQALAVASISMFSTGVAMAAGDKCWNKADGTEISTASSKKDCKAAKGVWSKHAPKVKAAAEQKPTTPPPAAVVPPPAAAAPAAAPAGGTTP